MVCPRCVLHGQAKKRGAAKRKGGREQEDTEEEEELEAEGGTEPWEQQSEDWEAGAAGGPAPALETERPLRAAQLHAATAGPAELASESDADVAAGPPLRHGLAAAAAAMGELPPEVCAALQAGGQSSGGSCSPAGERGVEAGAAPGLASPQQLLVCRDTAASVGAQAHMQRKSPRLVAAGGPAAHWAPYACGTPPPLQQQHHRQLQQLGGGAGPPAPQLRPSSAGAGSGSLRPRALADESFQLSDADMTSLLLRGPAGEAGAMMGRAASAPGAYLREGGAGSVPALVPAEPSLRAWGVSFPPGPGPLGLRDANPGSSLLLDNRLFFQASSARPACAASRGWASWLGAQHGMARLGMACRVVVGTMLRLAKRTDRAWGSESQEANPSPDGSAQLAVPSSARRAQGNQGHVVRCLAGLARCAQGIVDAAAQQDPGWPLCGDSAPSPGASWPQQQQQQPAQPRPAASGPSPAPAPVAWQLGQPPGERGLRASPFAASAPASLEAPGTTAARLDGLALAQRRPGSSTVLDGPPCFSLLRSTHQEQQLALPAASGGGLPPSLRAAELGALLAGAGACSTATGRQKQAGGWEPAASLRSASTPAAAQGAAPPSAASFRARKQ